jgi:hypothetical protein
MTPAQLTKAGLPNGYDDENVKNFYRKEMMWSHWYCNNIKSDVSVIKWTDDRENLEPNLNNIRYIINSVWNGIQKVTLSITRRYINDPSVRVTNRDVTYSHLISYFIATTGGLTDKRILEWKNNRLCAYITRLNDMIDNLKNCVEAIYPGQPFNTGLRTIIDERTRNPYGMIDSSKPLTPWPPSRVAITPTLAPVMANFERCEWEQGTDFWHKEDEDETDSDFVPSNLSSVSEHSSGESSEPAGGAGGSSRLRKTYGGARRYKQRKTLKKRRKGKRHTRRRT